MSTNQARAIDKKYSTYSRPNISLVKTSVPPNEFIGYIPIGDRVLSTLVTDRTSARAGLEKAVSEQDGQVLTYFDQRYNAHEVIGIWLPDGFSYCSGDQRKVITAIIQSGLSLDSAVAKDLLIKSARAQKNESMHFYAGKEGIPFTWDSGGNIQFLNSDEFRFDKHQNTVSWRNTNSTFDPQKLSDFDGRYETQGGTTMTSQALKRLAIAHGGNRSEEIKIENSVLIITVSTGEIASHSEYKVSLDLPEVQIAVEMTCLSQVQALSSYFGSSLPPFLFDRRNKLEQDPNLQPTPQIPISRMEIIFRRLSEISPSNDNQESKAESINYGIQSMQGPINAVDFNQRFSVADTFSGTTAQIKIKSSQPSVSTRNWQPIATDQADPAQQPQALKINFGARAEFRSRLEIPVQTNIANIQSQRPIVINHKVITANGNGQKHLDSYQRYQNQNPVGSSLSEKYSSVTSVILRSLESTQLQVKPELLCFANEQSTKQEPNKRNLNPLNNSNRGLRSPRVREERRRSVLLYRFKAEPNRLPRATRTKSSILRETREISRSRTLSSKHKNNSRFRNSTQHQQSKERRKAKARTKPTQTIVRVNQYSLRRNQRHRLRMERGKQRLQRLRNGRRGRRQNIKKLQRLHPYYHAEMMGLIRRERENRRTRLGSLAN